MDYPEIATAVGKGLKDNRLAIAQVIEYVFTEKDKRKFTQKYSEHYDVIFREMDEGERLRYWQEMQKPIYSPDKKLRVREAANHNGGITIKTSVMTFREYLEKKKYRQYGYDIELYPYKWYEWIYEVPANFIYRLLFRNSLLNARKPIQIATKIAIVLAEFSITYYFGKYVLDRLNF